MTRVRIVLDLTDTETDMNFSINEDHMPQMAGKIFKVRESPKQIKDSSSIRIWSDEAQADFLFATSDLTILNDSLEPLPKPEIFNPKHLDI